MFDSVDVNLKWDFFYNRYKTVFDGSFPKIKQRTKNLSKLKITPKIKTIKRTLDSLYVISQYEPQLRPSYLSLKKQYDLEITNAKKTFFDEFITAADNKSKAVWNVVNMLTKPSKQHTQLP